MPTRRTLLKSASMLAGAPLSSALLTAAPAAPRPPATLRDRLWLWSHVAGAYSGQYGLEGPSRITPAEAAHFLGVPNIFMIGYNGEPAPESLDQFAIPFQSLGRIAWAIVDPGQERTTDHRRNAVLEFAFRDPQTTGVVMDDFFVRREHWGPDQVAALNLDELKSVKQRLRRGGKRLDLWVVLYAHEIAQDTFPRLGPYLELCDVVQVWSWYGKEIPGLDKTLARVEQVAPHIRKALGCFMWDFGDKQPLPVAAMREQCEFGVEGMRRHRLEDMIICGSWLCDRPLESVRWTRQWIQKTGSQRI